MQETDPNGLDQPGGLGMVQPPGTERPSAKIFAAQAEELIVLRPRTVVVPHVERGAQVTFELPPWTGDVATI